MRWSLRLGTLFGVRVELHVTFLLFLGWIAVSQGLFAGDARQALVAVTLFVAVFACVLLHELGHVLTARRFGIHTRDIILLPIGGIARLERMPEKPEQEIQIAVAGPAVNLVIATALYALKWVLWGAHLAADVSFLDALILVNAIMLAFNLIPAFPMDGGRVLRAALAMRMSYGQATRIASGVGQGFALLFAVIGLFYNPMLIFVALFVFLAASEERAVVEARTSLDGLPVQAAMLTDFEVLQAREPLRRAVEHLMAGSQQDFPVVDGQRALGVLTREDLIRGLQHGGSEGAVVDALRAGEEFAEVGQPLEDVVRRMRVRGRSAVPVVQQGQLVGLLTLENVGDLLLLRKALGRHVGRE